MSWHVVNVDHLAARAVVWSFCHCLLGSLLGVCWAWWGAKPWMGPSWTLSIIPDWQDVGLGSWDPGQNLSQMEKFWINILNALRPDLLKHIKHTSNCQWKHRIHFTGFSSTTLKIIVDNPFQFIKRVGPALFRALGYMKKDFENNHRK